VRAVVVGGSIVGCAAAHALRCAGWDVLVFERSASRLETRGQGLVLPAALIDKLRERGYVAPEMPTIQIRQRRWVVKDADEYLGRLLWEQNFAVTAVSWAALFAELRQRVPDGAYRPGSRVVGLRRDSDGTLAVELENRDSVQADLVVAADGYRSDLRAYLFSQVQLSFSGYVIWRGWVDEGHPTLGPVDDYARHMTTFGFRRGHGNLWVIPGHSSSLRGHRQVAWNVYDPLDSAPFRDELFDASGALHSRPPVECSPAHIAYLKELAQASLPRAVADAIHATPAPIMTPVFDLRTPSLVCEGTVLLGDAGMVLRPVTGSGATKGLEDAMALGDALAVEHDVDRALQRFDDERRPASESLVRLGETMGDALVTNAPDWTAMSAADMADWHSSMMQGQRWYALGD
jgi:2-polyprenyl-6-methoxyphenol hydroxylase-like FAD-dependent oxidoreductase